MFRIEEELTINNIQGLHARPAAIFVQIANKYDSSIKLAKDDDIVDGKSIIAVLSLGASRGTQLKIILEGDDAQQALAELKDFLENSNEND